MPFARIYKRLTLTSGVLILVLLAAFKDLNRTPTPSGEGDGRGTISFCIQLSRGVRILFLPRFSLCATTSEMFSFAGNGEFN